MARRSRQSLKKGRGFIVPTLPAMPSTLRTYSRLCHPIRPHRSAPARQWHACGNRQRWWAFP
jgi:hypothetical protein